MDLGKWEWRNKLIHFRACACDPQSGFDVNSTKPFSFKVLEFFYLSSSDVLMPFPCSCLYFSIVVTSFLSLLLFLLVLFSFLSLLPICLPNFNLSFHSPFSFSLLIAFLFRKHENLVNVCTILYYPFHCLHWLNRTNAGQIDTYSVRRSLNLLICSICVEMIYRFGSNVATRKEKLPI